jgi:hypothetical protein
MAINFMEFLKEAFEDVDTLNQEQLRKVLAETHIYFETLENTLRTGDLRAKELALAEAFELKEFLDSKATNTSKFKGLDSLSQQEREMLSEIDEEIRLVENKKNKTHVKKLKPIKLS